MTGADYAREEGRDLEREEGEDRDTSCDNKVKV